MSRSRPVCQEIEFLFKSYKAKYWYWEVVETARRLVLTGILSVVATGSGAQIIFGIGVSLVYLRWYGAARPFRNPEDSILQEIAQVDAHRAVSTIEPQPLTCTRTRT
jgi:hypothetical protein